MNKLKYSACRVSQIAKYPHVSRTRFNTGRSRFSFRQSRLPAEITFINGPGFFFEIPCIIRTCGHTGLTANAPGRIHNHNPGLLIFIRRSGRTYSHTWWSITVVTENRHESRLKFITAKRPSFFKNSCPEPIGRNVVGFDTGLFAAVHNRCKISL